MLPCVVVWNRLRAFLGFSTVVGVCAMLNAFQGIIKYYCVNDEAEVLGTDGGRSERLGSRIYRNAVVSRSSDLSPVGFLPNLFCGVQ